MVLKSKNLAHLLVLDNPGDAWNIDSSQVLALIKTGGLKTRTPRQKVEGLAKLWLDHHATDDEGQKKGAGSHLCLISIKCID